MKETLRYRAHVDECMHRLLDDVEKMADPQIFLSLVRLGLEHEMQHQELLVYDIKHLLCDLFDAPRGKLAPQAQPVSGMAEIEGGLFSLGYDGSDFAFDNEKPAHTVFVNDFAIDRALVSNGDYLEFINAGG